MEIKLNNQNVVIDTENLSAEDRKSLSEALSKKKGLWKPKIGGFYYFIGGYSSWSKNRWDDDNTDKLRYKEGNVYETPELAQKELDKRIAIQAVKEYIAENDLGCEEGKKRYSLIWNVDEFMCGDLSSESFYYSPFGYLKSSEACDELIRNQRDNLSVIFEIKVSQQ